MSPRKAPKAKPESAKHMYPDPWPDNPTKPTLDQLDGSGQDPSFENAIRRIEDVS